MYICFKWDTLKADQLEWIFHFIAAFCDIPDLMTHLQNNYKYWKEQEDEATGALERDKLDGDTGKRPTWLPFSI